MGELTGKPDLTAAVAERDYRLPMTRDQREEWERQDGERMRLYAERQRLVRPSNQLAQP